MAFSKDSKDERMAPDEMNDIKKCLRKDQQIIFDLIREGARVLDLGCGQGDLLYYLMKYKSVKGTGIELSKEGVESSMEKGISVLQGDLETLIKNYPDNTFDYCILSQTLQELRNPEEVFHHMLRIAKYSVISFYNLAHIRYRFQILFRGKFPESQDLPYDWKTSNVVFLSARNFTEFCRKNGVIIKKAFYYNNKKEIRFRKNLRANICVFLISKNR